MSRMYMIRAGRGNYLFDEFEEKNIVAIGWNELGNLSQIKDKGHLKTMLSHNYDYKQQALHTNAGQIFRFCQELKIGDYAVTYSSQERAYLIGTIESAYTYDDSFEFAHKRKVKWLGKVSRDILSTSTKNSLGSIASIFEIKDPAKKELLSKLNDNDDSVKNTLVEEDDELDDIKEDIERRARGFIEDKVVKLSWKDMQELVAALLRSLGFKTKVSPDGADGGIDIIASRDGLGFEEPCICVQVKHREGKKMNAPEIKSFIQSVRSGAKGLYVSTGGFTKDAEYVARSANIPLTLMRLNELVDMIISNYDNFDSEGRALVPLRKIYWPA